jgi:hypothetical protein
MELLVQPGLTVHKDLKGHKDQPELMALLVQPELMG